MSTIYKRPSVYKTGSEGDVPSGDIVPPGTTPQNPLVNEAYVGIKNKVIAAALNDLKARVAAIESVAANNNLGSVIADSIDTQKLSVGGVDINTIIQNAIGG